jgi:hypothetical protein
MRVMRCFLRPASEACCKITYGGKDHWLKQRQLICAHGRILCVSATRKYPRRSVIANLLGVILTSLEVDVTADVDVRGTLTVDRTVPVCFQTMRCHVTMQAAEGANPRLMEKLLSAAEYRCMTLQTLRSGVSTETLFQGS